MRWDWLPHYFPLLMQGLAVTLKVLIVSVVLGFILAVPIGMAQVTGGKVSRNAAKGFCNYIRGTPLLTQIWLLYYGIGSLFPMFPWLRENALWLIRLDAIYYVYLAFTLSFAGYVAEIMRGAFLAVNKGELEAARAVGMSRWQVLKRIWLPSAVWKVLPTLTGEVIGQLKATPLAFTVPVIDLMGATSKVRQDTFLTYEPLLFLAAIYLAIAFIITQGMGVLERRVPIKR